MQGRPPMSMEPSAPEHLPPTAQKAAGSGCLTRVFRLLAGILVSSIAGWISGLVVSAFVPALVRSLGSETARAGMGPLSIALAALPFSISFLLSLMGGLVLNRRKRSLA
jgi:hypothetical protein